MGIKLASHKECTGCMACVDACNKDALKITIGKDGHYYPTWNKEKCINCGLCSKVCPIVSKFKYQREDTLSHPYAAWNKDEEQILKSASGGVFSAIATYILQQGGYVVGAVSEGQRVKHIVINDIQDLPLLQGSKYLQSNTSGIYKQVKTLLNKGALVLFSGTGCQVAGLLSFLRKKYDNLYTIDLVCAGVPSLFSLDLFCQKEKILPKQIRWRDKENGWKQSLLLKIRTQEENIIKYKPTNCFYWGMFLGGSTNRLSCYNCHFCGLSRISDFTIADYWGIKEYPKQQEKGISILISHSEKGLFLLDNCNLEKHSTDINFCISKNPRIINGKRYLFIERRFLSIAFKYLNYKSLTKIYAGIIDKNNIFWFPYKIFRSIRWRIINIQLQRKTKKIISNLWK